MRIGYFCPCASMSSFKSLNSSSDSSGKVAEIGCCDRRGSIVGTVVSITHLLRWGSLAPLRAPAGRAPSAVNGRDPGDHREHFVDAEPSRVHEQFDDGARLGVEQVDREQADD